MALQQKDDSFSPLPQVEFNVRTGEPLSGVKQPTESSETTSVKKTGTPKRGMFLRNRLSKLYNDPIFQKADDNLKQYYKEKAYDKWVVPYYKHINTEPPTKEEFITGQHKQDGFLKQLDNKTREKLQGTGYAALRETSKITGGLIGLTVSVVEGINSLYPDKSPEAEARIKSLKDKQQYFKGKEDWYTKQLEATNDGHDSTWKQNPEQKLAEVVTQGVFFEATGAAKGAKILQIANPRTAGLLIRSAKSAWNTAVGFGLWSASQGETPSDIGKSAATGAVLGPAGMVARKLPGGYHLEEFHDMLHTMFKYGGADASKVIINDAVNKATQGHGNEFAAISTDKPMSNEELKVKIEDLLKSIKATEEAHKKKTIPFAEVLSTSPLTPESKVASSAISIRLHEIAQQKYSKTFDKLPWIQQRGVINTFLANDVLAAKMKAEGEKPSAEVLHTMIKEQQEKLNQVSPVAAEVDKKVGEFVKANGSDPSVQKIKATMPHHNTTIDSSWKHLQARAAFLKGSITREKNSEIKKQLRDALNEEYKLMKDKAAKEKFKSKPGGALINDTNAFKGDDYLIRPADKTDSAIFGTWRQDKFAGELVQKIAQESPVGMMDRKVQALMTSFQAGSMLEMFAKDQFQDTVVLHHPKYGPIGGANYSIIEDRGGALGKTLMLNWIALRPNVVAKVYDTPGAGQTLFLSVLEKARAANAGVELHSAPSAKNFYEKMGMVGDDNGNFKYTSEQVKDVLKNKGLLMGLIGTGIGTWAATKDQLDDDITVVPKDYK